MATYGNYTEDQLVTGLKDLKGQGKTDAEIFDIARQNNLTSSQAVDIYNKAGLGGGLLQSAGFMNQGLSDWLKANNITEDQYRTAAGQAGLTAQGTQDLMVNQGPYKVNVNAGQYANSTGAITQDSVNLYQSLFKDDKVFGKNVVAKLSDGSTFQRTENGRGIITRADGTTIDVGPETDLAQLAAQNKGVADYFGIGRPSGTAGGGASGGIGSGGLLGAAAGGTGEFSFSSGGAAMRGVRPEDTVKQQLTDLLASNSTYVDQARARALQTANARGLLNTSLAAGAGAEAAISQALPISQQDAATYFKQGLTNQEATNQFNLAAQERAARSQEAELGRQFQSRENAFSRAQNQAQFDATMKMNNDRFAQQFGLDKAQFDANNAIALQNLGDAKLQNYRNGLMNIINGTYPNDGSRQIALDAYNATFIGEISPDAISRVSAATRQNLSTLPPSTTQPTTPTTPTTSTTIPEPGQPATIDGRTGTIIAGPDGRRYFQDSTGVYEINTGPDIPTPRVPSPTDANRVPV